MSAILEQIHRTLRARLLEARNARGIWEGELSDSALSTALAVSALLHNPNPQVGDHKQVCQGIDWLLATQCRDGSWGDTTVSPGNLATTAIVWATLGAVHAHNATHGAVRPFSPDCDRLPFVNARLQPAMARAETWIEQSLNENIEVSATKAAGEQTAGAKPPLRQPVADFREALPAAITALYGADRTFAVPILSHLAWSGALGHDGNVWRRIPPLPFGFALLPHWLLAALRLHVVSYALPALIAIGLARHIAVARAKGRRAWGALFLSPLLRRLEALQPDHGGFLDAAPLTAFVTLGLTTAGESNHTVAERGRAFLRQGQRANGAWPIDTNLSLWVTSLATRALTTASADDFDGRVISAHLLATQHRVRHPFTRAAPGGWGWSDCPGAIPDGDDTAAALIALHRLGTPINAAIRDGLLWLIGLQNRDGGIPTFCRGWGRLPFDQSCPDLTAHACSAWQTWMSQADAPLRSRMQKAERRAVDYLLRQQRSDGTWHPLWFGSAERRDGANPTFGTARVAAMLRALPNGDTAVTAALSRSEQWLVTAQKPDGSWGADALSRATIEETAWAVIALAHVAAKPTVRAAALRGAQWLAQQFAKNQMPSPAPIGLYFAQLWYFEKLYPLIWSVEALGLARLLEPEA